MQVERYRRRLESHVAHGNFEAALATLNVWREHSPDLLEPELLHARIDLMRGRYRAAHDRASKATLERDCPPGLALDVVNCLRVLGAHEALYQWAAAYPHRAALTPVDRARAAAALETIGAHALAKVWVDEAVAQASDDVTARVNRALTRSYAGEFDEAAADLERAIAQPGDPAIAHWMLARLRRQRPDSNHVARLRARLAASAPDSDDAEYLNFALFKELDDLGETAAAWAALSEGCRLVRTRVPHDRRASERLFAALQRQFPLDAVPATEPAGAPLPIFIVGMHRSGTTLLESMFAAHTRVHAGGESQRLSGALRYAADRMCEGLLDESLVAAAPTLDYTVVRDRYIAEARAFANGAAFMTEKMPGNFRLIGFMRHALPHAKVLHLRREPMDLCFANLRELFAEGVSYSYALEDLAHFHAQYEALMRHWHAAYPGFVLDVDYEALVRDPLATSRRVFEFCGLEWNPGVIEPANWAARAINTLSSVQARQPPSAAGIGRWKTYAQWLEPLRILLNR